MNNQTYASVGKGLSTVFIGEILCILGLIPLVGGILAIIGLILTLVGLNTAGQGDSGYKTAFLLTIVNLVFSIIGTVVTLISFGILGPIVTIISTILGFLIVYYVCMTSCNLLTGVDDVQAAKGTTVWKLYAVCAIVSIICTLLSLIPGINIIAGLVTVVIAIVQLVAMILYLIFLNKASKIFQSLA